MSKSKAGDGSRRDGGKERIWREAIADQRQSGESIQAFCRARGLNESSFYRWRKRIRLWDRQASGKKDVPPVLAPVVVVDAPLTREPSAAIEIVLAGGYTVRVPFGVTREQLGMVLAVLEPTRC
jgi:transposase-like protein